MYKFSEEIQKDDAVYKLENKAGKATIRQCCSLLYEKWHPPQYTLEINISNQDMETLSYAADLVRGICTLVHIIEYKMDKDEHYKPTSHAKFFRVS